MGNNVQTTDPQAAMRGLRMELELKDGESVDDAILNTMLKDAKDLGAPLLRFVRNSGRLPEEYLCDPDNDVREGPFVFVCDWTDNGAIGLEDDLTATVVDVGILRDETSGSSDLVQDQLFIFTGFRISVNALGQDTTATSADIVGAILASIGLKIETATSVKNRYTRHFGGSGAGTLFQASAVENTNAATAVNVALKPAEWRRMPPTPFYLRNDTLSIVHGAVVNAAGNLKVQVEFSGVAFNWTRSDYRPGIGDCGNGKMGRFIGRRRRALRTTSPLLNL